jgi:hypothetical protein
MKNIKQEPRDKRYVIWDEVQKRIKLNFVNTVTGNKTGKKKIYAEETIRTNGERKILTDKTITTTTNSKR